MIIQCQGCAAKYFLPEDKVPENPLKVRCPKCTAVFTLVPQLAPVGVATPAPAVESPVPSAHPAVEHTPDPAPDPAQPANSAQPAPPVVDTALPPAESAQPAQQVAEPVAPAAVAAPPAQPAQPAQPVAEPVAPAAAAAPPAESAQPAQPVAEPAQPTKSAKSKRGGRSKDDRAKRLARVLVSDILCYNQDRRDQALEDGTLMTVLGEEIKKSWELYKEKVGPDLANSTNYFKEALNEILADGQEVF